MRKKYYITIFLLLFLTTFVIISGGCSKKSEISISESKNNETTQLLSSENEKENKKENESLSQIDPTKKHSVLFYDQEGNVISSQMVQEGESAVPPRASEIDGYAFSGWDTPIDKVTSDISVKPMYKKLTKLPCFVVGRAEAGGLDKDIEVNVLIKNNPGFASASLDIYYDKENLALTGYDYNFDLLTNTYTVPFNSFSEDHCLIMINGTDNIYSDGIIATLYFDSVSELPGEYPIIITYDPENVYNLDEKNIDIEIENGLITIR